MAVAFPKIVRLGPFRSLKQLLVLSAVLFAWSAEAEPVPVETTWTNATGDELWETPGNWTNGVPDALTGGPTQAVFSSYLDVRMEQPHVVDRLRVGSVPGFPYNPLPSLDVFSDLTIRNELFKLPLVLQPGATLLIHDGAMLSEGSIVQRILEGEPTGPARVTAITGQDAAGVRLSGMQFEDRQVTSGEIVPLILDAEPAGAGFFLITGDFASRFTGGVHVRAPLRAEADVRFSLGHIRAGGVLDAPITVAPEATLYWSDTWTLGPSGYLDVGEAALTLQTDTNDSPNTPTYSTHPSLEIDLSRVNLTENTHLTVRDSLTLTQLRELRNLELRPGRLTIDHNPSILPAKGESPQSALDLEGRTVTLEEFTPTAGGALPGDPLSPDSRFVLADGTLRQPGGGPVALPEQIEYLWNVTLDGGVDFTHQIPLSNSGNRYEGHFGSNVIIQNGPLTSAGLAQGVSTRIDFGQLTEFDPRSRLPNGLSVLRNVTVPKHLFIDVYEKLRVEGGLHLDGGLIVAGSSDNSTEFTFAGTQTISGSGSLYLGSLGPDLPSEGVIYITEGDLTLGSGITVYIQGHDEALVAGDNDLTVQGELSVDNIFPTVLTAATLSVPGVLEIDGRFRAEAERFELHDGSTMTIHLEYPIQFRRPDAARPLVVTGHAELDGALVTANTGVQRSDLVPGARERLIGAGSITGRFDTVTFADIRQRELTDGYFADALTWAVLYTATTVDAELALRGDADLDGIVHQDDLDTVLGNWGRAGDASWTVGDLDQNGLVEQGDLDSVLLHWGGNDSPDLRGFSAPAVPEPAGALALTALGLAADRHRA